MSISLTLERSIMTGAVFAPVYASRIQESPAITTSARARLLGSRSHRRHARILLSAPHRLVSFETAIISAMLLLSFDAIISPYHRNSRIEIQSVFPELVLARNSGYAVSPIDNSILAQYAFCRYRCRRASVSCSFIFTAYAYRLARPEPSFDYQRLPCP